MSRFFFSLSRKINMRNKGPIWTRTLQFIMVLDISEVKFPCICTVRKAGLFEVGCIFHSHSLWIFLMVAVLPTDRRTDSSFRPLCTYMYVGLKVFQCKLSLMFHHQCQHWIYFPFLVCIVYKIVARMKINYLSWFKSHFFAFQPRPQPKIDFPYYEISKPDSCLQSVVHTSKKLGEYVRKYGILQINGSITTLRSIC